MDTDPAMLSVRYRAPEGRLRNGDVTGYEIRYTIVGSGVSEMMNVSSGNGNGFRTSVIPGLVAFTNYSVQVAAININGTGPHSDPVYRVSGQNSEWSLLLYMIHKFSIFRTCYCSRITNSSHYPVKICDIVVDGS